MTPTVDLWNTFAYAQAISHVKEIIEKHLFRCPTDQALCSSFMKQLNNPDFFYRQRISVLAEDCRGFLKSPEVVFFHPLREPLGKCAGFIEAHADAIETNQLNQCLKESPKAFLPQKAQINGPIEKQRRAMQAYVDQKVNTQKKKKQRKRKKGHS